MKFVEFYKTIENGQAIIGKAVLDNGKVILGGLPEKLVVQLKEGIKVDREKKVFPNDGIGFLAALAKNFSGSYLRASKVLDG